MNLPLLPLEHIEATSHFLTSTLESCTQTENFMIKKLERYYQNNG